MNLALQYADIWMQDEAAVIARGLRHRDPDLLDRLIEQYQHRLFRYLLYFTGDRALAEDLFQETWIRVMEKGSQYNPSWKFETWLISVARNLAIDHMRRKLPVTFSAMTKDEEDETPVEDRFADQAPHAEDRVAERERDEQLSGVLESLPPHYREVLTLRFHEEMQLDEIARATGVPLSTVKSRLHRGLEQMERRMKGISL